MTDFGEGYKGLHLEILSPGDIVTVRLRPESRNPHHYRETNVWKVCEINSANVVVEQMTGDPKGRRQVWQIDAHAWFEASSLLAAYEGAGIHD